MGKSSNKGSPEEKTISGTIWTFYEKILAQGASLIVSIFLSRLLFPEEYGVIAVSTIFISISTVFVDCGLGTALVQKKDVKKLDYSTAFSSSLILALLIYVVLFFTAKPIALIFGTKYDTVTIVNVIRLMALKLPFGAYVSVQNAYIQKNYLFKEVFWGSLIGTVLSGVFGVICAYLGFGAYALVIQTLSDGLIDMVLITIIIKWGPGVSFSKKSFSEMFGFGSKIFLTTLIDRCYNSLTDFVIGKKYTSADLALYNKGLQIPHILCVNVEGSIEKALFPTMANLQDQKEKLKKGIRKSIQISSYVLFPMLVGLMCVGKPLIKFLFTENWVECVPYLKMLCISYLTTSIRSPLLQAIKAVGRSDIYLKLDIVKKVIGISALLISFSFGPFWICFANVCSSFMGLIVNIIPSKKLFNYSIVEIIVDIIPSTVLSVLMGCLVYALNFLVKIDIILLFSQIAIGITSFILFSILLKNKTFMYIYDIVMHSFGKFKKGKAH